MQNWKWFIGSHIWISLDYYYIVKILVAYLQRSKYDDPWPFEKQEERVCTLAYNIYALRPVLPFRRRPVRRGHVTKLQCKIRYFWRARNELCFCSWEGAQLPNIFFFVRFEISHNKVFRTNQRGNLITININCAYKLFYINKIHYNNKTVWVFLFIVQYQNTN